MRWPKVKLGDIGEFKAGFGFPHEFQGKKTGQYPFAKVGDISNLARAGELYISKAANYVSSEDIEILKAKTLPAGTIVFAKIGEAIRQNFRLVTSVEMVVDNNVMGLIPNTQIIDVDFLYHFLCKLDLYQYIGATTVPALRKSVLENIEIPLPTLSEQQHIAAVLNKIKSIQFKRDYAIKLADEFLRTTFLSMFGDPENNPKQFPIGTIRDLVSSANYGSSGKASEHSGRYPMLRMGNITYQGYWDFTDLKYIDLDERSKEKFLVRKGDLLFNRTNSKELVGKTAVFESDIEMAYAGYLVRVRTNELGNNHYISGYLNSAHGKNTLINMSKSIVGMANINAQEMQNIKILIPPVKLQYKYEEIYKAVRNRVSTYIKSKTELDKLFNTLSNQLFN
ncbi:restriction endonuclease subunit S [Pantoea agglomerans]|uniref:restriction endonuclease subunit S n=1 Tax=Enterobacter agglomerans TaxID=549 RepID=UPI0013C20354|nr:restriction endonuclease subunit S [Pantoea agglomerans]NEG49753.1 restriction endonuclease [Pantoea agglomerans]